MEKSITYTLSDLNRAANFILDNLSSSKTLLFNGEIGVGKTTLIKELVTQIGSNELVSSPTFSIVNDYSTESKKIYHFDLFRLKDTEDLYNFGVEDYLHPSNWLLIEWPDLIIPILYDNFNLISIFEKDNFERKLIIKT